MKIRVCTLFATEIISEIFFHMVSQAPGFGVLASE
jgi:hypothetical protein